MAPLTTLGFHHVTMVSADARRTVRFYRDVLGLRLVKRTVNFDDPSAYHLYFGDATGSPGSIVTFFEWPHVAPGSWGVGGIHHLALSTRDRGAQLRWKRRLSDAGVSVSGPYDRGYFHSIYFRDPDGQVLEIATAGPGYDFDEPRDALGERFIRPDSGRLAGRRDEVSIRADTHPEPVPEITPEMELQGIHHVTGITDDMESADRFYREALGLRLVKRTVNQDDAATEHFFWAHYDGEQVLPASAMTLFGWPPDARRTRPGIGQTHHIAFRARDDEEQEAWGEHLRSLDIPVTSVQDRHYFKSIYFPAPDGLLVEIATDGPGFAVDEAPESLGHELRLPPWMEKDRDRIAGALVDLDADMDEGEE